MGHILPATYLNFLNHIELYHLQYKDRAHLGNSNTSIFLVIVVDNTCNIGN